MRLGFHRHVTSDISQIMDYYEAVAGAQLADDFYAELRWFFKKAAESPEVYSIRERDIRRVNLEKFPFHFLFRIADLREDIGSSSSPKTSFAWTSPVLVALITIQ
jgi:hypothetical protein